jgi:selenium metabolism protein YedF
MFSLPANSRRLFCKLFFPSERAMSILLDCTDLPCPQPVLRTKEALDQGATSLEVLVDNEAAQNNILRFAATQGCHADCETLPGGKTVRIHIRAGEQAAPGAFTAADFTCALDAAAKMIYVSSSDTMGRGSEELGWALMQTYVQTIKDVEPLPRKIVLYNGGVKLVTTESGALDALKALQERGVEILACGACLDFFQLKSAIQVGQISNMHEIMSTMAGADKIVSPF